MINITFDENRESIEVDKFLDVLRNSIDSKNYPISLHEPEFVGNEWQYVRECLDTGWVSSAGKFVDEFEIRLAEFTGANYAIAVVNGTSALHAALVVAGVQRNDEVLLPALTFVATPNAIIQCGAIPHFVDSTEDTLGLDPLALKDYLDHIAEPIDSGLRNKNTGRRISAVVPMHTFGHPMDINNLLSVAETFRLHIIEDAAESLGSFVGDIHTGTFGLAGALSFNGNKIITTGGGGAILTNDASIAKRVKHLTTTAKISHPWEFFHDESAWNYRMPNLNAALGCAQLESLPDILVRKRLLAERYQSAFAKYRGLQFIREPNGCRSNYWLNTVLLDKSSTELRDDLISSANSQGFQCRPAWTLMHRLPMYMNCPRAPLPIVERLAGALINLPSSSKLIRE
jgi:perosamine synthetase